MILSPTFRNERFSAIHSLSAMCCWPPGRPAAPGFLPDVSHAGRAPMIVRFTLNGRSRTVDVEPSTLVADMLRENLNLTGTHVGCDTSQCGACVVLFNGEAVKSCTLLAPMLDGGTLTTIEGLSAPGGSNQLHPMQQAFHQNHGLQCGFCTPGMVMTAVALASK